MTALERWVEAFRRVVENPTQNATAVGAAIAIVVLAVIVIILLALALVLPGKPRDGESGSVTTATTHRGLPQWVAWSLSAMVVLTGVTAAVGLWYTGTSTNEYCTKSCHAMAEPTETWALSAHADVSCVRCHEGRLWESLPRALASRAHSLYLEISGAKPRGDKVPSGNCMSCHANVIEKPLTARNGEVFLHGEVLTVDDDCVPCHGRQGHVPGRP